MKTNLIPEIFLSDSTFDTYHLGQFYEKYVLTKQYYPYQFDGWRDKKHYGIIDQDNNIVYPKKEFLKSYSNEDGRIFRNLNFVVDAFQDLKKYYEGLVKENRVKSSSIYTRLNVAGGTEDAEQNYITFVEKLYGIFKNTYLTNEIEQKIKSINSFVPYFIDFIKIIAKGTIINRSSFFKSRLVAPAINGLRITLLDVNKDTSLRVKANTFMNSYEFNLFIETCGKFGFAVDRNEPWCIVADLSSDSIKKYYNEYNIKSYKDVFQKYYHNSYEIDIDSLASTLTLFWNLYAKYKGSNITHNQIPDCKSMFAEVTNYNQISPEVFEKYYTKIWQIRLYFYSRVLEERVKITQNKFEALYNQAVEIYNTYNETKAVMFINEKINEIIQRDTKNIDPLTKRDAIYTLLTTQQFPFPYEGINF